MPHSDKTRIGIQAPGQTDIYSDLIVEGIRPPIRRIVPPKPCDIIGIHALVLKRRHHFIVIHVIPPIKAMISTSHSEINIEETLQTAAVTPKFHLRAKYDRMVVI